MKNRATEFRVGLFSLVSLGVLIYILYLVNAQFFERSRRATYRTLVDNAQGIVNLTAVRTGGVLVGQVTNVRLVGEKTEIEFSIDSSLRIPQGSGMAFRSRGLLGETFLEIIRAADSDDLISEGGIIPISRSGSVDMGEIMDLAGDVATDVQEVTTSLRQVIDQLSTEQLADDIEAVFADMRVITSSLREIIDTQKDKISHTMTHLSDVSARLAEITASDPLAPLHRLADDMSGMVAEMNDVVSKVGRGEGTLGQLINDDHLIKDISEISQDVKDLVSPASRLTLDLRYQNELRTDLSFQHHVYALLSFRPNRTYRFGITAFPQKIQKKSVVSSPAENRSQEDLREETVTIEHPTVRVSAQVSQRWKAVAFRFGLFEGVGGLALDTFLWGDRLSLSAEAFDFRTESEIRQFGRMKLYSTVYMNPYIFVTAGVSDLSRIPGEQPLWQAIHPFMGGGFQFTDNDAKNVLQLVP